MVPVPYRVVKFVTLKVEINKIVKLRIRDVNPGSQIHSQKGNGNGSGSSKKNSSTFNPKKCCQASENMIRDEYPGSKIRILDLDFSHPRSRRSKKAPNPGSGFAKLDSPLDSKSHNRKPCEFANPSSHQCCGSGSLSQIQDPGSE